ncbi:MAG: class I SAM-dependent methyltransferase [Acidimicrobiales bacterium]
MQADEFTRIAQAEDDHWWYRHTRALMAEMLAPWLRPGSRILDAGCGPGGNSAFLSPYGKVVGADISPDAMRLLKVRWPETAAVQASIGDLPFGPASFDVVVTVTVLAMLPDDRRAVAEVARVLRPGGAAFFIEAAFPALRRGHDVVCNVVRRYRRPAFEAMIDDAGLSVQRATYAHSYLVPPAALLAAASRVRRNATESAKSDLQHGRSLDKVFTKLTAVERRILARRNLPAGVSVVAVATKR